VKKCAEVWRLSDIKSALIMIPSNFPRADGTPVRDFRAALKNKTDIPEAAAQELGQVLQ
jgi:hypothetical protein